MPDAFVFALALLLDAQGGSAPAGFGVAVTFSHEPQRHGAEMKAAGIEWVRADLSWSHAEPQRGRYDFRIFDAIVDGMAAHGIRTLFILDYGNALYDGGFPPTSAEARAAYAAFAAAAVRHFRGRVTLWEIWNEPNVPRFWVGEPDPAAYVALAREAVPAMRREDPAAFVVGPGVGGDGFDLDYLERTFQLGLLELVDGISVHPYGAAQPEEAAGFYADVRRLARVYAPRRQLPLVVTEWGYPAAAVGAKTQADLLMRALAVNRRENVPLTIWFCWQDPVIPWHSFGLLDARGQPRPAYDALRQGRE